MKRLAVSFVALAISGAAFAQTTEIRRTETPAGESTTVTREHMDGSSTTTKRIDSTGSLGCDTKSVTETNEDGESRTKSRTRC